MKEFPPWIKVVHKPSFDKVLRTRTESYLRRSITEHIISHPEHLYFSLEKFNDSQALDNLNLVKELVKNLIPELQQLGWNCKLSYGGTGLFIYSTPNPPPNCVPDEDVLEDPQL